MKVDFDRCEGHGLCTLTAPDVFSFDDMGQLEVVERAAPEHRAAVEEAIRTCPALAITTGVEVPAGDDRPI